MPRRSQDMRHIEYRSGILQFFPPPSQLPKGGGLYIVVVQKESVELISFIYKEVLTKP